MSRDYKRAHIRAPLRDSILYLYNEKVYHGHVLNISEGGLLLESVFVDFKRPEILSMINVLHLPYFKNMTFEDLLAFEINDHSKSVLKLKIEILRGQSQQDDMKGKVSMAGGRFVNISKHDTSHIAEYVKRSASNVIHCLMGLDQSSDQEFTKKSLKGLELMGYDMTDSRAQLRKTLYQDYLNLQWLE